MRAGTLEGFVRGNRSSRKCFREGLCEESLCRMSKSTMKLRERTEAMRSRSLPTLLKVSPDIPAEEEEQDLLRKNLRKMGCAGLLDVACGV